MHADFEAKTGIRGETVKRYQVGWLSRKGQEPHWMIPVLDEDRICRGMRLVSSDLDVRWASKRLKRLPKLEKTPQLYGVDEMVAEDWRAVFVVDTELE